MFEIAAGFPLPRTKEDLLVALKQQMARPFYSAVCAKCQKPTDFNRWMTEGVDQTYEAKWKDPWEPFFGASRDFLPLYDVRFQQVRECVVKHQVITVWLQQAEPSLRDTYSGW